ncbi:class I SAM-dependent methyltransferase [Flindersiella endophytica]
MTTVEWNPQQYLRFADQRARPYYDLMARVGADSPIRIVDLGCGPGNLTETLLDRWPDAYVEGIDSSPQMIESAKRLEQAGRLSFQVGDLRDWKSGQPVDLLISNATLQWIDDHLELLPSLVEQVVPGGWFAFQVPGNFQEPSHRLLVELASSPAFAEHFTGRELRVPHSYDPAIYLDALERTGCVVDAWETTYLYLLQGEDPVLEWIKGTGARPYLQALPDDETRSAFEDAYRERLREAYPPRPYGTVLPYRRIFAVAQKPNETDA